MAGIRSGNVVKVRGLATTGVDPGSAIVLFGGDAHMLVMAARCRQGEGPTNHVKLVDRDGVVWFAAKESVTIAPLVQWDPPDNDITRHILRSIGDDKRCWMKALKNRRWGDYVRVRLYTDEQSVNLEKTKFGYGFTVLSEGRYTTEDVHYRTFVVYKEHW